jgi:hypothetical protein
VLADEIGGKADAARIADLRQGDFERFHNGLTVITDGE